MIIAGSGFPVLSDCVSDVRVRKRVDEEIGRNEENKGAHHRTKRSKSGLGLRRTGLRQMKAPKAPKSSKGNFKHQSSRTGKFAKIGRLAAGLS